MEARSPAAPRWSTSVVPTSVTLSREGEEQGRPSRGWRKLTDWATVGRHAGNMRWLPRKERRRGAPPTLALNRSAQAPVAMITGAPRTSAGVREGIGQSDSAHGRRP